MDPEQVDTFVVGPRSGHAPAVGVLAAQLGATRHFTLRATRELDAASLDAVPLGGLNPIGSLLRHLAAAERMFQVLTFEGRPFDEDERARWWPDFSFEAADRPRGLDVATYQEALAEVRAATLAGLRERDEAWLARPMTFGGRPANVHYYWTHLLLDEARHTGQIIVARKYLIPGADPTFQPYA